MRPAVHSQLIEVLRETRQLLARPSNDFAYSSWATRDDALGQIDSLIARIQAGDMPDRPDLSLLFTPTGCIQEVAESSVGNRSFWCSPSNSMLLL